MYLFFSHCSLSLCWKLPSRFKKMQPRAISEAQGIYGTLYKWLDKIGSPWIYMVENLKSGFMITNHSLEHSQSCSPRSF